VSSSRAAENATLDRRRLVDGPLLRLTHDEMSRLERSLKAVLGLYE